MQDGASSAPLQGLAADLRQRPELPPVNAEIGSIERGSAGSGGK